MTDETGQSLGTARIDVVVNTAQGEASIGRIKTGVTSMSDAAQEAYAQLDAAEKRRVTSLIKQADTLGLTRDQQILYNAAARNLPAALYDELVAKVQAAQSATQSLGETQEEQAARLKDVVRASLEQIDAQNAAVAASTRAASGTSRPNASSGEQSDAEAIAARGQAILDAETRARRNATAATNDQSAALGKLLAQIDPVEAALSRLDALEAKLATHKSTLSADDYSAYKAKIDAARDAVTKADGAVSHFSLSSSGAGREFGVLVGEIARGDLQNLQGSLLTLANRTGLLEVALSAAGIGFTAAAAAGAVFIAGAIAGAEESDKLNRVLIATGQSAVDAGAQIQVVAANVGAMTGTYGGAREAIEAIVASGVIFSQSLQDQAAAVVNVSQVTGQSIDQVVQDFAKLQGDPTKAIVDLNDKYHFLTESTYAQIAALQEQGNTQQAAALAEKTYSDAFAQRAQEVKANLGIIERSWDAVRRVASSGWDAIKNAGRQATINDQLAENSRALAAAQAGQVNFTTGDVGPSINNERVQQLLAERSRLQAQAIDEDLGYQAKAQQQATDQQAVNDRKALQDSVDAHDKATQKKLAIDKAYAQARGALLGITGNSDADNSQRTQINQLLQSRLADINKQFADHDADKLNSADNAAQLAQFKQGLQAYVDAYANAQRELDDERKAGTISAADYYAQSHAELWKASGEQVTAIQAEIDALQRRDVAGVAAIKNQQEISTLQAQLRKLDADSISKDNQLTEQEAAERAKATAAINAYIAALGQQTAARQSEIDLQVQALGMGQQEYQLQQRINKIYQDSAAQQVALARQLNKPNGITQDQFDSETQSLKAATDARVQAEREGYARMGSAQADWASGADKAFDDYRDKATNVSAAAASTFEDAFGGLSDSLATFATTGKLSFSSLATSIINDLAKIEARILVSTALQAIFPSLGSAPQALSSSENQQALLDSIGEDIRPNAKGGVYTSPSLSSYSDGIYSSPKMFAFAKGAGVFAEAGPEAIMPLTRGSDGSLGVRAAGSSTPNIEINVINNAQAKVTTKQGQGSNGMPNLSVFIDQIDEEMANRVTSGRSKTARAIGARSGTNMNANV